MGNWAIGQCHVYSMRNNHQLSHQLQMQQHHVHDHVHDHIHDHGHVHVHEVHHVHDVLWQLLPPIQSPCHCQRPVPAHVFHVNAGADHDLHRPLARFLSQPRPAPTGTATGGATFRKLTSSSSKKILSFELSSEFSADSSSISCSSEDDSRSSKSSSSLVHANSFAAASSAFRLVSLASRSMSVFHDKTIQLPRGHFLDLRTFSVFFCTTSSAVFGNTLTGDPRRYWYVSTGIPFVLWFAKKNENSLDRPVSSALIVLAIYRWPKPVQSVDKGLRKFVFIMGNRVPWWELFSQLCSLITKNIICKWLAGYTTALLTGAW